MYPVIIGATLALQVLSLILTLSMYYRNNSRQAALLAVVIILLMIHHPGVFLHHAVSSGMWAGDWGAAITGFVLALAVVTGIAGLRKSGWSDHLKSQHHGTVNRFQLALASGRLGIWDWEVNTDVLFWDGRMADLYGIPRKSSPRRIEDWQAVLHGDDRERFRKELTAAIKGDREYDTEFRVVHGNGSLKVIKADGHVIRDAEGNAERLIGLNRDITEQRWAEQEIISLNDDLERRVNERTKQLKQVNASLRREIEERILVEEKLKSYTAQLRSFSSQLMEARESERRHIAHELHDEIGQELTGLKLALDRISRAGAEATAGGLVPVQKQIEALMSRTRDLSFNLRPALLDDLGIFPTLRWHFNRYTEQTGVKVDFRHDRDDRRFPPEIETVLFRVIQEALTNAARYAGVDIVHVALIVREAEVIATVEDNGAGFHRGDEMRAGETLGLTGIRERVEDVGGRLLVESDPGKGTLLRISIPLISP